MKYAVKNRPLGLPKFFADDPAYMDVPEVSADEGSVEESFFAALRAFSAALAGIGRPPGTLAGMSILVPSIEAFQAADQMELDLRYREVLAGNFCETVLVEDVERTGVTIRSYTMMATPDTETTVYGSYTTPQLNIQYLPRTTVPETPQILASWRETGCAYQEKMRSVELVYGESARERIDLYLPESGSNWPLHLYIHGGYWQALDKRDNGQFCDALRRAVIAVAVVNYDLCPDVTLSRIVEQARAAVGALYRQTPSHGCDVGRFTVSGHSAGGHLAAVVAATDWQGVDEALPADLVKGAVLISGLFELEPIKRTALNRVLRLTDAEVGGLSPVDWAPRCDGPMVVVVGDKESDEFKRQSHNLEAVWRAAGADLTYLEAEGCHHFTVVEALNNPDSPVFQETLRIARCEGMG